MEKSETGIINVLTIGIICCTIILSLIAVFLNIYAYDLNKEQRTLVTEKGLNVDFGTASKNIKFKNATPGTQFEREFTIAAKEDATSICKYKVTINVKTNNINPEYLKYIIESSSSLPKGELSEPFVQDTQIYPSDGEVFSFEASLKPGEVHSYKYTLYYTRMSSSNKNNFDMDIEVELISESTSDNYKLENK